MSFCIHYSKNIHTCCLVIWWLVTIYTIIHQEKPWSNGLQTTFAHKDDMITNEKNKSISTSKLASKKNEVLYFSETRKEYPIWCRPGHVGGMDCLFYVTRDIPCYSIFFSPQMLCVVFPHPVLLLITGTFCCKVIWSEAPCGYIFEEFKSLVIGDCVLLVHKSMSTRTHFGFKIFASLHIFAYIYSIPKL